MTTKLEKSYIKEIGKTKKQDKSIKTDAIDISSIYPTEPEAFTFHCSSLKKTVKEPTGTNIKNLMKKFEK